MKLFNRIFAALTATLLVLTLALSAAQFVGFDADDGEVASNQMATNR